MSHAGKSPFDRALAVPTRKQAPWMLMMVAAIAAAVGATTAQATLIHRYDFATDASDSVGGSNGTLRGRATVSGGNLRLNNPDFSPASDVNGGYLSLSPSILPASGSVTIQQWFNFTGSGFFTEAYTFTNHGNDFVNPPSNPPNANNGQYLMHVISNPQPAVPPGGPNTGGSRVSQALSGYQGSLTPPPGGETFAFETTPGLGAGGGGYLDNGVPYMATTVIDGTAGTISYYVYRLSDGAGGLQQTVPATPLSSYSFTNAYLGRSAFLGDNWTSGAVDEFRIFSEARSAGQIAADFRAGPNVIVPEPAALTLVACAMGLLLAARRRG